MISELKEQALLDLIDRGQMSERKIADKAGVARGTVRSRKSGYRGRQDIAAVNNRCPTCGAKLAEVPCRACQLRRELGIDLA